VEFCTKKGDAPLIAYTTCIASNASPDWHETFRFDTQSLDPTAYLIAWVVSAPGEDYDDIIAGSLYSLTEEQLQEAAMQRAVTGIDTRHYKPDFNRDLPKMLKRQTHYYDKSDDAKVHKDNAIARLPNPPPASTYQKDNIPPIERRWNDVMNLRQMLQKTSCEIQDPLIPRTHMPLGCIVARFRHLRGAVWGTEPITMNRMVRLNCKGSLNIELDFRPRFFLATDPLSQMKLEEEFVPRTPRVDDLEVNAETQALDAIDRASKGEPHGLVLTGLPDFGPCGREAMQANPDELYKKYKQVNLWAKIVLSRKKDASTADFRSMGADLIDSNFITTKVAMYQRRYEAWQEKRALYAESLDEVVEKPTAANAPRAEVKKADIGAKVNKGFETLPILSVEPWLDEILEGSRLC